MFTAADIQEWLAEAHGLDLTDPKLQSGIRFLEQLLSVLVPKETELLPNYPNPFNPETWIPYRLAEDAFVTLVIYDQRGSVVRRFNVRAPDRLSLRASVTSNLLGWQKRGR